MHRRYPPADEVYGIGYVYLINPKNNYNLLYRSYSTYGDDGSDDNDSKDDLYIRHRGRGFHHQNKNNNNSNSDSFELRRSKT